METVGAAASVEVAALESVMVVQGKDLGPHTCNVSDCDDLALPSHG